MPHRLWPTGALRLLGADSLLFSGALDSPVSRTREDSTYHGSNPSSLKDAYLTGASNRRRVRVVVASDISGSMEKFTASRESALSQLVHWIPGNLRRDDELAVLSFGAHTLLNVEPTSIRTVRRALRTASGFKVQSSPEEIPADMASSTSFSSLLQQLIVLRTTRHKLSLILLSDGEFTDLPDKAETVLTSLRQVGVDEVFLLVPRPNFRIQECWRQICSVEPAFFDGMDTDAIALAFGQVLATITGTRLAAR